MPGYEHPRLKRFMERKPDAWFGQYKERIPKSTTSPDKVKRIITLLGASDYSISEIGRLTKTGNSTVIKVNSVLGLRTDEEVRGVQKRAMSLAKSTKAIPWE